MALTGTGIDRFIQCARTTGACLLVGGARWPTAWHPAAPTWIIRCARKRSRPMKLATRVVHAGLPPVTQGSAFSAGITFAAPYHAAGDPSSSAYTYGRYHNPTWTRFELALS